MTDTTSRAVPADMLVLDATQMTKYAINVVRIAMGVMGVMGVALGIALLFWPGGSIAVVAAIAGIYFAIAGVARIAVGVLANEVSGGYRVLSVVLGLVLLALGIVALKNLDVAATVLAVLSAVIIGVGWIIEGIMVVIEAGRRKGSGLAIAAGIIGIIAGVVVVAVPVWSAFAFVMLTGIMLLVLGAVGIVRALQFGKGINA
jgi:uncharacterized membrane protein HdeD (DUF308 family)